MPELLDWWSLGHLAWGLLFGWLGIRMGWVAAIALGWELVENVVLGPLNWGEPGNPIGMFVDVAVAVAGAAFVVALKAWLSGRKAREALDDWDN